MKAYKEFAETVNRHKKPMLAGSAVLALAGLAYVVDSIHIKVKTRAKAVVEALTLDTSTTMVKTAGTLPVPEITISIDEEDPPSPVCEAPSQPPLQDFELDVPLAIHQPCPPGEPLCHVGYSHGMPYCLIPSEACLDALSEVFGFYAKKITPIVLGAPAEKGPWSFGPYGAKPEFPKPIIITSRLPKIVPGITVRKVNHRYNKKETEDNDSELALPSQASTTLSPEAATLIYYVLDPNRSAPLSSQETKMMIDIGKKIVQDDDVQDLLKQGGISCNDIIHAMTVFINDELQKGGKAGSEQVNEHREIILWLAQKLGFEKQLPPLEQWMWVKVPESLIKKEVCQTE